MNIPNREEDSGFSGRPLLFGSRIAAPSGLSEPNEERAENDLLTPRLSLMIAPQ